MTLTFEPDLDGLKSNQQAKYLDRRSFSAKVMVRTPTHTWLIARPGPLKWSVLNRSREYPAVVQINLNSD